MPTLSARGPFLLVFCYIRFMTLAEKIQKDLVDSMRAKDELRLSVLRGIKSAITYKETEKSVSSTTPNPFSSCKHW